MEVIGFRRIQDLEQQGILKPIERDDGKLIPHVASHLEQNPSVTNTKHILQRGSIAAHLMELGLLSKDMLLIEFGWFMLFWV